MRLRGCLLRVLPCFYDLSWDEMLESFVMEDFRIKLVEDVLKVIDKSGVLPH